MTSVLGDAQNNGGELECTMVMTLAWVVSMTFKGICPQVSLRPGHEMY